MHDEYTRVCERPAKVISQRQTQHCQFETPPPNSQNVMQYSYTHHQVHTDMIANNINQQPDFQNGLENGDVSNHIRRGKVPGSNIQAVDMDVNEILKVCNLGIIMKFII